MKKAILIIIFIVSTFSINAQTDTIPVIDTMIYIRIDSCYNYQLYRQSHQENKGLILALYISSVALNAVGDALNDNNKKVAGHICNALSIGSLLTVPFVTKDIKSKWIRMVAGYAFIRFATFNYTYNSVRGLPINYVGNSSIDDKMYRSLKQDSHLFEHALSLGVGVGLVLGF